LRRYAANVILAVFAALVILFVVLPLIGVAIVFVLRAALVGLIVGALGRLIVPGHQPIGALATVCCGWVGALIGGGIGHAIGVGGFATVLIEIGVAAALVAVWSGTHRGRLGGPRRDALTRF
jgi:uncharacterized membrane protein YeaQ/YmgE (transglycosylase-associated protein family)